MTRVLHTGDTHLGYRQYHIPARRADFQDVFQQVAEDAISDDVDAVVHAGDLFHDRQPSLTDILGALDVLRTLASAEIPFLAIVGNHEGKRDAQWLDLFEEMNLATRLDGTPEVVGDVAMYGLDFVPRSRRDDLNYEFEPHDCDRAMLVSHGLFQPFDHGDWDAERLLEESTVEFDALLLGDDHDPKKRYLEEYGTWLTYCGSTERASAAEREPRGYNIVAVDDGIDIRRRGLDTREFVFIDVELGPGEGAGRVRERMAEHDLSEAVVIVTIEGEGDPVMPASIEEFGEEHGALVTRVNDHRELSDETEVDVQFANPDDAVEERLSEMGLSVAARDLDETIRASKVADSNVADEVERRVSTFVDEADSGAFEPAGDADSSGADGEAQNAADGDAKNAADEDTEHAADGTGSDSPGSENGESPDVARGTEGSGEWVGEDDGDGDGQVTMEDYL